MSASAWALGTNGSFSKCYPCSRSDLLPIFPVVQTHLQIAQSFPYDFVNLDFCGYYYPQPPNVLRINETVERMLRWQAAAVGPTGANPANPMALSQFVLSVTCRY